MEHWSSAPSLFSTSNYPTGRQGMIAHGGYPENRWGACVPTPPIGHSQCGGLRTDLPCLETLFSCEVVSQNG